MDFSAFQYLTFDCYGTLIDWESGILAALRPVLTAHGIARTDEEILHLYAECEAQAEQGAYQPYRRVLEQVVCQFGARLGFVPSSQEAAGLADSVKRWRPFPDTVEALRRLATRYQLALISNIDDDLLADTRPQLGVEFAQIITAQQARSYKPALHNFQLALQRLGTPTARVLHVAQSLYHDVEPAKRLGLTTVWVNRRRGKSGFGATVPGHALPDLEVADLHTLASLALR